MVRLVKAMVSSVVMYGCESWSIKKAERWKIDAFKLWCWRILLRDLREIQPVHPKGDLVLNSHWKDWSWSWNSNTLATWWEELTHWKRTWCWERLKAGGEADDRGWNGWWHHWLNGGDHQPQTSTLSKLWDMLMDRVAWCATVHAVVKFGHNWVTELN